MFNIQTLNKISPLGLAKLDTALYTVDAENTAADAILVRSANMLEMELNPELMAIARAGAGYNNIPIDRCAEAGIPVFNTPGANANAVKELAVCALLLASRDIEGGSEWVRDRASEGIDVTTIVEKGKAQFAGPELYRKTLGIIGLGVIGSMVANTAIALGMEVYGYDPYISVDSALRLDRHVHIVKDLKDLYRRADYLTIHTLMTESTRGMIDENALSSMKRGVRVLNLARGEIVNDDAMLAALATGKVAVYVTDFPNNKILAGRRVIPFPHLGASTPESEQNCALMAVRELRDYLEYGNIVNSVNLPSLSLDPSGAERLCLIHRNIPAMLANITALLGKDGVNVENMSNKSRGEYAYTLIDVSSPVTKDIVADVKALNGIIRVRHIIW